VDLLGGQLAIDDEVPVGIGAGEVQEEVANGAMEVGRLGLETVMNAVASGSADVGRQVDQHR
jgi:hypothetical protein